MNQQIIIREIVSPQPGKKQYSLIDTSGQRWGVMPEDRGQYTVGGIYEVVDSKSSVFQGKTYVTLNHAKFIGMEDGSVPLPGGGPAPSYSPPPQRFAAPRTTAARSAPPRQTFTPQPSNASKDMHIFVCGALNNILSNPNVNPLELTAPKLINIVQQLTTAWRQTLGGETRANDDMNDEIPDFGAGRQ